MKAKDNMPYHQDFLIKAFSDQLPKHERSKISNQWGNYQKTNQNNQKGTIKR